LRSLGCPNGHAIFQNLNGGRCINCSRHILVDDPDAMFINPDSVTPKHGDPLSVQNLRCKHCSQCPFYSGTYHCPLCDSSVSSTSFTFLPPPTPLNTNADTATVEEQFKEEIASYESWDQ
jgi:hypothetical protein